MSTIKAALTVFALLGSVTFAQATSFDPNMANRYPAYAEAGVYGYTAAGGAPRRMNAETLQSKSVSQRLQSRNVALPQAGAPSMNESWMDRASQSFSGGGY